MHAADASYLALSAFAGAAGRALRRGLPAAWRSRLEARPPEDLDRPWVWLHAVSMGEIILCEGLAGRLAERGQRVHITTGTAAGLELLERRVVAWNARGGRFSGGAFPLDDPRGLAPFLDPAPALFIALETELWPGLLQALAGRRVPALIVNGRLTRRSLARGGPWLRGAAARLSLVLARDPESAAGFAALGAPRVLLGGNLKADLPPPAPLHPGWTFLQEAWAGRRVLVAGNTVEGEEELVLDAWAGAGPSCGLILAPRQPRRFETVARLLASRGLAFNRASAAWPASAAAWAGAGVLLLDTLGELASAYQMGSLALVGGGWTWEGGHNPLESLRWGVPTWIGPGYANFADLVDPLRAVGLVKIVEKTDLPLALTAALDQLPLRGGGLGSLEEQMPPTLKGALEKTWNGIQEFLPDARLG